MIEAYGIPLVTDPTPANIRDHTLRPATLDQYRDLGKVLGPLPEQPALSLDAGESVHGLAKPVRRSENHSLQPGTSAWSALGVTTPSTPDLSEYDESEQL